MLISKVKYFFLAIFFFNCFGPAKAQGGLCPSNLDFESGDFTGWVCQAGIVDPGGNLILNPTPPIPGRHTIISAATAGADPYGRFSELCPNGSGFSVRLGNSGGNHEAESISYTYSIPSTLTVFSMLFHYAVVLQNPNHNFFQQPRFRARITDLSTNLPIPCVDFDFIPGSSTGGFLISPSDPTVVYKDWTPITINLNAYIGKTIKLEFITNDCIFVQHFGYAYIDVNTACNGAVQGSTVCIGDTSTTLTAPFGFQNYAWYSDITFNTIISNSQTVTFTPPPTVGTVYPVIVDPYPGFGCRDTLYATISVAPRPVSNAGPDLTTCEGQQVQIGGPPIPGYIYSWTPAGQVTNPIISNPFAWNMGLPTEFIVRTTDLLTGCISSDSAIITSFFVDTALQITGKKNYCAGDPAAGTLSVSNTVSAVQWYNSVTPIPGATGLSYQPTTSGSYWAEVQQSGCTDSTRTEVFNVNPAPVSNAGPDASVCTNNQTIQIGTQPNPAYNYSWTPAIQLSNASIADPFAWAIGSTTTEFVVHTTDALTGCNSYDTIYITGRVVDTSILLNGKNDFCIGDAAAGILSVNNTVSAVQWYDRATPIPGATGFNYRPLTTGNYWAQLQQLGCTDSTATLAFDIHALPIASFTSSSDTGCVTNNSYLFTNASTVTDGSAMTYLWKFSDGSTQTVTDATKTFLNSGNYITKLVATTANGCKDSTTYTVHVLPNGIPNFSWDSICVSRPISFYNLSNEKGSVLVKYNWDFANGGPGSVLKDPPQVVYTSAGKADVTLKLVALGCESDTQIIVKTVQINKQAAGVRYRDITVPQGSSKFLHVRDTIGKTYLWRPPIQLSNYYTQYTEFFATTNDVEYKIDISDVHTCITTDTIQILILRKPGYYLPTAFTPNGDGLNDVVKPYLVSMKSLKSFSVYNRWGNLVFYSVKEGEGWDGKVKGVEQNAGVYIWILEFINSDDKKVMEKGHITIIR